jgi:uncharacterized protein (TIGR00251 family)
MSDSAVLTVLAHPGAREERVGPLHAGALRVAVQAAPEKGKANRAVLEVLARALGVPRSSLSVVRGETSRRKEIRIEGMSREALARFLASVA